MRKTVMRNLVVYAMAAAIVWYAARGVSWTQVAAATSHATLWVFGAASLAGFLCWFIGETVLYSRLFTYFHRPTEALEVLPTMAALSFLQIVNSNVAGGALVLFLHSRKRVPWITSACTVMFQAYVDTMLLAALSLAAIVVVPTSPIREGLALAAGALGAGCLIASFWLSWGSRLRATGWLRWVYDRPSMVSFRMAQPSHYARLLAIKFLVVLGSGFALYGQFVSFHIEVPLTEILALTPFLMAIGNAPISPGGIGTTQLVFTLAFARFAGRDDLFALSLAVTAFNLLVRIPMGLAMRAPLMNEAVDLEGAVGGRQRGIALFLGLALLMLASMSHAADDQEARETVQRVADLFRSNSSVATLKMQISGEDGRHDRSMKIWSLGEKTLVRIDSPQDEAGTAILKVGSNIWYYLPKSNRTVKVPASAAMTSWMGSAFTIDDLVKETFLTRDYSISRSFEGKRGEVAVREYTLTPNPEAAVVWSKIVLQIRQADSVPTWQGYYGGDGRLVRELVFSQFKPMSGRLIPTRLVMRPADKPTAATTIDYDDIAFDVPVPEETFTLPNLKQ